MSHKGVKAGRADGKQIRNTEPLAKHGRYLWLDRERDILSELE